MMDTIVAAQPMPEVTEKSQPVLPFVLQAFLQREAAGTKKYGVPLSTHNKRQARVDRLQEMMDWILYEFQELLEEEADDGPEELTTEWIKSLYNMDAMLLNNRRLQDLLNNRDHQIEELKDSLVDAHAQISILREELEECQEILNELPEREED